ncbi:MAG: hypothetical protein CL912_23640 [Deltaproteobacteria bacterium]|nr:hypothetical protein [Deltaproteobacteria bacterium]
MTGYNGVSPGPTLQMTKGREAVVQFINNSPRNSSIHLHGSKHYLTSSIPPLPMFPRSLLKGVKKHADVVLLVVSRSRRRNRSGE